MINLQKFRHVLGLTAVSALATTWVGCAPSFEGTYSDPAKAEIVDDRWNETDARKTAEALVNSVLNRPWLTDHQAKFKQRPVVVVDDVQNRTDEHIDTKALTDAIQDELINSGKVRFVSKERRQQILDEVKYQSSGAVAEDSRKKLGRQIGADFMMAGAISSSVHSQGSLKTVTYQINLQLIDLETAEIVWSDRNLIKKRFNRSRAGW
ncbi:MAG: penicillin-binding protein activator LpoB [Oligoflexus sp.]